MSNNHFEKMSQDQQDAFYVSRYSKPITNSRYHPASSRTARKFQRNPNTTSQFNPYASDRDLRNINFQDRSRW